MPTNGRTFTRLSDSELKEVLTVANREQVTVVYRLAMEVKEQRQLTRELCEVAERTMRGVVKGRK